MNKKYTDDRAVRISPKYYTMACDLARANRQSIKTIVEVSIEIKSMRDKKKLTLLKEMADRRNCKVSDMAVVATNAFNKMKEA